MDILDAGHSDTSPKPARALRAGGKTGPLASTSGWCQNDRGFLAAAQGLLEVTHDP